MPMIRRSPQCHHPRFSGFVLLLFGILLAAFSIDAAPPVYVPSIAFHILSEITSEESGYFSLSESLDGSIHVGTAKYNQNAFLVEVDPRSGRQRVVLDTAENPRPEFAVPASGYAPRIDYGYAFGDACVWLDGYPIPILPPSGIMQVAAYEGINVEAHSICPRLQVKMLHPQPDSSSHQQLETPPTSLSQELEHPVECQARAQRSPAG